MKDAGRKNTVSNHAGPSFWFGIIFIALGCFFSEPPLGKYKAILKTLKPVEVPAHTNPKLAFILNVSIAALAAVLVLYLITEICYSYCRRDTFIS